VAKSKCIHMLPPDRSPITTCGVDTSLKHGAAWTVNRDEVTCNNCLKLITGGQMGAPPPSGAKPEASEEDKRRWRYEDRVQNLQRIINRLRITQSDLQGLIGSTVDEEDVGEVVVAHDYVDMAVGRLDTVMSQVSYVLHKELGEEG